jgi:hypothetical protein
MINKIIAKREEWEKFYAQANIDKENNNSFNIPVKCIEIFEPEIKRCEKIEMKINIKHARIYQNKLQSISSIAYRSNHRPVNYVIRSLRYVGYEKKILNFLKNLFYD